MVTASRVMIMKTVMFIIQPIIALMTIVAMKVFPKVLWRLTLRLTTQVTRGKETRKLLAGLMNPLKLLEKPVSIGMFIVFSVRHISAVTVESSEFSIIVVSATVKARTATGMFRGTGTETRVTMVTMVVNRFVQ